MSVQRYTFTVARNDDENGTYVRHAEYAALLQKIDALRESLRLIESDMRDNLHRHPYAERDIVGWANDIASVRGER